MDDLELKGPRFGCGLGQCGSCSVLINDAEARRESCRRHQPIVTYGELIGNRRFNLAFTGSAPAKPVSEYRVVGKPTARKDVTAKVSGNYVYMQQVRVPGMLHGRIVRPRGQGAYGTVSKVLNVDEASIPQHCRRSAGSG